MQDTNKQVKDTPFPSITICTEGINMDAALEAVTEQYSAWLLATWNITTGGEEYSAEEQAAWVKQFLLEVFSISPSYNISMADIILAFSTPQPDT